MNTEFRSVTWDNSLEADLRGLIRLAIREDLDHGDDWTTRLLVPDDAQARAAVVARQAGVVAGLPAGPLLIQELACRVRWIPLVEDGTTVQPGDVLVRLSGHARDVLTLERTLLNILCHLGGIASLTAEFVRRVAGTSARVYDTRKTLPGWRRLQKYAVRCGGGWNHRMGLYDAVLIKDNHLCQVYQDRHISPAEAVQRARLQLEAETPRGEAPVLEVEVDSLDALPAVLAAKPDLVLLDNFDLANLRAAVALRNATAPAILLEASGGVRLDSVAAIAETGVDRISVGAITHSAPGLDLALDWC